MPWKWQSQKNPYKEVLFTRSKIPVDELNKKKLRGYLKNAGVKASEGSQILEPNPRYAAELLAHQPHKRNLTPLDEYKKDFGQKPLCIRDIIAEQLPSPEHPLQTVRLPQQHMDTILQPEIHFLCLPVMQREDHKFEIALDS